MVEQWGKILSEAYAVATNAAKIVVKNALVTTGNIGKNVATTARVASEVIGEMINTVGGLTAAVGVSAYSGAVAVASTKPPRNNLLVQSCPTKALNVFNNAYRATLINSTFVGAGDKKLASAMKAITEPLAEIDLENNLRAISEVRGRSIDEVKMEYKLFEKYRLKIDQNISRFKLEAIEELEAQNEDFMGSVWQLRYGKVTGDHLGIDPVFGALLNPTGGLVGPGNSALSPESIGMPKAVAYHGAYHYAMGFLHQYLRAGHGYNYMKSPIGLDTSNPMAGQATGIMQWSINLAD